MTPKEIKQTADKIHRALNSTEINGWEMGFLEKLETRLGESGAQLSKNESYRLNQICEKL